MRHGTRARYVGSSACPPCRCDPCRRANTLYRRRERANGLDRRGTPQIPRGDTLLVNCWCDTTPLRVPKAVLLAGDTLSCGRRHCHDRRAA